MKKVLMLMVVAMVSLAAFADVKVENGSVGMLKDPDTRVLVTWDYSNLQIEGKKADDFLAEKGEEWIRDFPRETTASEAAFAVKYNQANKKFAQITDDDEAAQYELVIHLDWLHYGSTAAAVVFGGFARGANVKGTVDVVNMADKSVVATISFDSAGTACIGNENRRILAYYDLAECLYKIIKKSK